LSNTFLDRYILRVSGDEQDHTGRILSEWHAESPELDMAPVAVIGRILRAARYLERAVEAELGAHGLNIAEFNALSALRRVGPPFQLTPSALSHHLLFTSGGLTKLLERLERSGLIRREPATDDRRVVLVCLTPAGRARQEAAMEAHLRNEEELLAPLSSGDRDALAGTLRRLLVGLERAEGRRRPLLRAIGRDAPS
jgi:DNA-binding MarR family transcriptional regulator